MTKFSRYREARHESPQFTSFRDAKPRVFNPAKNYVAGSGSGTIAPQRVAGLPDAPDPSAIFGSLGQGLGADKAPTEIGGIKLPKGAGQPPDPKDFTPGSEDFHNPGGSPVNNGPPHGGGGSGYNAPSWEINLSTPTGPENNVTTGPVVTGFGSRRWDHGPPDVVGKRLAKWGPGGAPYISKVPDPVFLAGAPGTLGGSWRPGQQTVWGQQSSGGHGATKPGRSKDKGAASREETQATNTMLEVQVLKDDVHPLPLGPPDPKAMHPDPEPNTEQVVGKTMVEAAQILFDKLQAVALQMQMGVLPAPAPAPPKNPPAPKPKKTGSKPGDDSGSGGGVGGPHASTELPSDEGGQTGGQVRGPRARDLYPYGDGGAGVVGGPRGRDAFPYDEKVGAGGPRARGLGTYRPNPEDPGGGSPRSRTT